MVDDELVEERWFLVDAEFDIGALSAPVAAELVGRGPRHQRIVPVAVDQHRRVGSAAANPLRVEQAGERFLVDHLVDVFVELRALPSA